MYICASLDNIVIQKCDVCNRFECSRYPKRIWKFVRFRWRVRLGMPGSWIMYTLIIIIVTYSNLKKVTIGSFCACFRPKDKYTSDILRHLFVSNSYRHIIKRTLTGSAINNLKPSDIEGLSLRINLKMKNFNYLIKKLNALSDNKLQIENSIKISRQLLKSTINQIFNGI